MENNPNVTTLNNTNMSASQTVPQHFKSINRQVSHLHSDISQQLHLKPFYKLSTLFKNFLQLIYCICNMLCL